LTPSSFDDNAAVTSLDAFAELERTGWERAAAQYESCWNDTELFVDALLDAAGVRSGMRVLDVACGPGFVSESAALRGATPVGLDFAAAMVERAVSRRPGLEFVVGDAQKLPFRDGAFDAVTMNFGILHMSEPERAIGEARRVLAPGARYAFTAWVEDGNAVSEIVEAAVAAHAIPVDLPEGPPFYRFADASEAARALVDAGFDTDSIRIETATRVVHIPEAEQLFEAELRAGVRTAAVLARQPADRLERIRAAVDEGVRRYPAESGFELPIVARVVSAAASHRV
jgi:SAM-dependent methyltransferase